jgi:hypothetical protein
VVTVIGIYDGWQSEAPQRHAWSSRLVVTESGQYLQFVTVIVDGQSLMLAGLTEPTDALMSALASRAAERVREAIETGAIPTSAPTTAVSFFVHYSTVQELLSSSDVLPKGAEAFRFELPT